MPRGATPRDEQKLVCPSTSHLRQWRQGETACHESRLNSSGASSCALHAAGMATSARIVDVQDIDRRILEQPRDQSLQSGAFHHLRIAHRARGVVGANREQTRALLLRDAVADDRPPSRRLAHEDRSTRAIWGRHVQVGPWQSSRVLPGQASPSVTRQGKPGPLADQPATARHARVGPSRSLDPEQRPEGWPQRQTANDVIHEALPLWEARTR